MVNKFLIIPLILGFVSCGQLVQKSTQTDSVQMSPEIAKKEIEQANSEHHKLVKTAKHSRLQTTDTSEQLAGSSRIKRENKKDVYFLYGAEHLNLKNNYFDFPVVYNAVVKKWMDYFLSRGKDYFIKYTQRAGRYAPVLGKILEDYGLPRDLIFLAMAESGFNTKAKSWAKAVGPWQFMPYTGKRYGLKIDWYVDERRDPIKATIAAANYLDHLYEKFGSWELAAASYNAGEGKIGRAIKRYRSNSFWKIRRGRYLKSETKNYVPKIMALAIIGKNLESFGFNDIDMHEPLDFDEVDVPGNTDLYQVAEALNVEWDELKRINPELRRWMTPPNVDTYKLRVPVGYRQKYVDCCSDKQLQAKDFATYSIRSRKGAKLKEVARKFKIKDRKVLEALNGVSHNSRLKKGTDVVLPFHVSHTRKESMYGDLYDRPIKRVRRKRAYRSRIRLAKRRGTKITNPSQYYTVKKGDTLWSIARKTGQSLDTIIKSNLRIVQARMIRVGDKLVVK